MNDLIVGDYYIIDSRVGGGTAQIVSVHKDYVRVDAGFGTIDILYEDIRSIEPIIDTGIDIGETQ